MLEPVRVRLPVVPCRGSPFSSGRVPALELPELVPLRVPASVAPCIPHASRRPARVRSESVPELRQQVSCAPVRVPVPRPADQDNATFREA